MAIAIIGGDPGETWTNDTAKILWQFHCNFKNSCALCIQFANRISTYWPIPLHFGCNCRQVRVRPGEQAEPFVDYQAAVADLDPRQQARVMGVANWHLVSSGAVKWEDVVTRARIRDFREVVSIRGFSVKQLVGMGITRYQAEKAHGAVNTPAHAAAQAERATLVKALRGHGVKDERIVKEVAAGLAGKVGVVLPPAPWGKGGPPPLPKPAPKPPAPKPATKAARSVEELLDEAEAYAKSHGVKVDRKGFAEIAASHGTTKAIDVVAAYRSTDRTIYLNQHNAYWKDPAAHMAGSAARGWSSTSSPEHPIRHEVGHAKHHEAMGDEGYAGLQHRRLTIGESWDAMARVGQYAASSAVEFVAEVFAGMADGRKYADKIMSLYRQFKGPEP